MRMTASLFFGCLLAAPLGAQDDPSTAEVRQIILFDFLPGRTGEAIRLFRDEALPLYVADDAMLRFRGYREAESPEPLDLLVVSTFRGMAGMDASNRKLGELAREKGTSLGDLYGRIGALGDGHRDFFVEMDPRLSWGEPEGTRLVALVFVRTAAGGSEAYEKLLAERVVPWERSAKLLSGSETGRFLLADGATHFRVLAIDSLEAWHRYVSARRREPWWSEEDRLIVERKQRIVAPLPELSVR